MRRSLTKSVGGFGLLCAILFGPEAPAADSTIACENTGTTLKEFFGMHVHRFHDQRLVPGAADFGTWRLWDAGVTWQNLEPERGKWDFRRLELALSNSEHLGVDVGLTLGMTPKWASARPAEKSFGGEGAAAEAANLEDWDRYVWTVVSRYKGRIKFYEVWNEPASSGFYTGSVFTMVELAKRAHKIIKFIDPHAIVVTPAPAKAISIPWFQDYINAGGLNFADVVGYHFYTDQERPEALVELIWQVKRAVRNQSSAIPVWNTESGLRFSTIEDSVAPSRQGHVSSSAHIARWLIIARCLGIERFIYYAWDNDFLGMVDSTTAKERTTLAGWRGARRWLLGARMKACKVSAEIWECELEREGVGTGQIVWAVQKSAVYKGRNAEAMVIVEDLSGSKVKINENDLVLTGSPLFIFQ